MSTTRWWTRFVPQFFASFPFIIAALSRRRDQPEGAGTSFVVDDAWPNRKHLRIGDPQNRR
jgi:hypothetical protein